MKRRAAIAAVAVLAGGALSVASYWIALWAMTKAPIPLVAATRESSVLFAAAIGIFVLREPVIGARIAAALLATAGAMPANAQTDSAATA